MITIYFDKNSMAPMYDQLYSHIKTLILSDELIANTKLPSKRKLSEHLKISIQTVETAYSQLVAEGYLYSVPKSGYFVEKIVKPYLSKPIIVKDTLVSTLNEKSYKYDFQTNVVDQEKFPYQAWSKIEKSVSEEDIKGSLNHIDLMGYYLLRKEIAAYLYQYRGITSNPENILIGSGTDYFVMIIALLAKNNSLVGLEDPGYFKLEKLYKAFKVKTMAVQLDKSGFDIQSASKENIDIVHVTPSHQFPSGKVMPVARRMELLEWANKKTNRFIVEDDYDSEFRFQGNPIPAVKSMDYSGKVIYMNAFTKSMAPSLRISFMVLPDSALENLKNNFGFLTCPVSLFNQASLQRFMHSGLFERHLNRMKNIYKAKRDFLIDLIKKSQIGKYFQVIGSEAGLHFLLEANDNISETELVLLAKKNGVRVRGLQEYCLYPVAGAKATIVLGYSAIATNSMSEAVKGLEKAWKIYLN